MAAKSFTLTTFIWLLFQSSLLNASQQTPEQYLDQAFLACEQGQDQKAKQLFQYILQQLDPPQGIRALIEYRQQQGCAGKTTPPILFEIGLAYGFSDNINFGVSDDVFTLTGIENQPSFQLAPEYLPNKDHYKEVRLQAQQNAWQVRLQKQDYQSYSDRNQTTIMAAWNNPKWRAEINARYLDQDFNFAQASIYHFIKPNIGYRLSTQKIAEYAGQQNSAELFYSKALNHSYYQLQFYLGYRQDLNDNSAFNAAAYGPIIRLSLSKSIKDWNFNAFYYQHLLLANHSYSPGLISESRENDYKLAQLSARYVFTNQISIELIHQWNHSNDKVELFNFKEQNTMLRLAYQW